MSMRRKSKYFLARGVEVFETKRELNHVLNERNANVHPDLEKAGECLLILKNNDDEEVMVIQGHEKTVIRQTLLFD